MRLAAVALAFFCMLGACSVDPYAPYDFKTVPGYKPASGIDSPAKLTTLRLESDSSR